MDIPLDLLARICKAFLEMQDSGGKCSDYTLFEDLDKILEREDRRLAGLE